MKTLKNASTEELIEELASRKGVEKSSAGIYQPYKLIKKYTG